MNNDHKIMLGLDGLALLMLVIDGGVGNFVLKMIIYGICMISLLVGLFFAWRGGRRKIIK